MAALSPWAGDKGWRLLVAHRGKHCPRCKKYLAILNDMLRAFEDTSIKVAAVCADPRDRAETEAEEEGWCFPVAYDLSLEQMRELGLYISDPRSPQETDRPFAEPATFAINPDGNDAGHLHFECTVCAVRPRGTAVRVEVHPGKAAPGPGHEGLTP